MTTYYSRPEIPPPPNDSPLSALRTPSHLYSARKYVPKKSLRSRHPREGQTESLHFGSGVCLRLRRAKHLVSATYLIGHDCWGKLQIKHI